ncbi:hypothetical protein BJF78_28560 [Pseudonocardia sp. CNS-139]|nr:hypothetical protein BJF78_28560 [Pseudonocardia sp. CNS-139]
MAFDVVNTGNLRLRGTAVLELSALFGLWNRTVALPEVPEILPGQSYRMQAVVDGVPPLLWLGSTVRLDPAAVGQDVVPVEPAAVTATTGTVAVPWLWLLVLAAVAAGGVLAARRNRRRREEFDRAVDAAREEGRRESAGSPSDAGPDEPGAAERAAESGAVATAVDPSEPSDPARPAD